MTLPTTTLRRVTGSAAGDGAARAGRAPSQPGTVLNPVTAAAGAVGVRSSPAPLPPPVARGVSEHALFHAYRATRPWLSVVRPCLCGEPIEYDGGDLSAVMQDHQRGEAHSRWRAEGGMDQ